MKLVEGFVRDGVPGSVREVCSEGLWWEGPEEGGLTCDLSGNMIRVGNLQVAGLAEISEHEGCW
jgi:hypothetical protein